MCFRFICIYPVYINSKKTLAEGRRIPTEKVTPSFFPLSFNDALITLGHMTFCRLLVSWNPLMCHSNPETTEKCVTLCVFTPVVRFIWWMSCDSFALSLGFSLVYTAKTEANQNVSTEVMWELLCCWLVRNPISQIPSPQAFTKHFQLFMICLWFFWLLGYRVPSLM